MYEQRRLQFVSKMKENNADVAIINSDTNIYYLTGYYSNPRERLTALFIFPNGDSKLLVPSLNRQSAEIASVSTLLDYKDNENPFALIEELIDRNCRHIALEENSWSTARYKMLSALLPDMKSVDATEWIDQIRKIKTADEVDKMKQAIALTEQGLEYGISLLSQDLTEQEVALEIEYKVKQLGAEKLAFDVKVISGQHSALPHGKPRKEKIQSNSFVLFDMGVSFEGYNADISRTVVLGKATEEMERIYTTVREALELAMKEIKPGVTIGALDRTAREYINDCGYGSYFIHRLGHGLGLELHEYPSVHGNNEETLEKGMVFTVEPGIYIPHIGGVRIEENVLVTEDGFELLTNAPKHLRVIERT